MTDPTAVDQSSSASERTPTKNGEASVTTRRIVPSKPEDLLTWRRSIRARRLGVFALVCLAAGVACGVIWKLTAPLPSFTIAGDGTAVTTDQALADFFGADADFMVIGMLGGVALGVLAWFWFKSLGWMVSLVAVIGASLAALIAWLFALLLGPRNFEQRVSNASAGAQVTLDLTLRTPTSWLLWPVGAALSVLVYNIFRRDGRANRTKWKKSAGASSGTTKSTGKGEPTTDHSQTGDVPWDQRLIRFPAFNRRPTHGTDHRSWHRRADDDSD